MPITIRTDGLDRPAPLYRRYPDQSEAQPAHIYIDADGEVAADIDGEIGGAVPMAVWHRRVLRVSCPPDVNGRALRDYLEGIGRPLLERVHAGHTVHWDGSNYVGHLDDDARDALDRLERELADLDLDDVWAVDDWLWTANSLSTLWTNEQLDDVVERLERQALADKIHLDGDVRQALLDQALRDLDHGRDVTRAHLEALVDEGMITQERADAAVAA